MPLWIRWASNGEVNEYNCRLKHRCLLCNGNSLEHKSFFCILMTHETPPAPQSLSMHAIRDKIECAEQIYGAQKGYCYINYLSVSNLVMFFSFSTSVPLPVSVPCRWIQSLPEALAHWPLPECVHDRQVLVGWLVHPEALRPAGVQHCPGPGQSPEDRPEAVHSEQTLPQTTSHQSAPREVAHWDTLTEN